jgi:hypothetical protein
MRQQSHRTRESFSSWAKATSQLRPFTFGALIFCDLLGF